MQRRTTLLRNSGEAIDSGILGRKQEDTEVDIVQVGTSDALEKECAILLHSNAELTNQIAAAIFSRLGPRGVPAA